MRELFHLVEMCPKKWSLRAVDLSATNGYEEAKQARTQWRFDYREEIEEQEYALEEHALRLRP